MQTSRVVLLTRDGEMRPEALAAQVVVALMVVMVAVEQLRRMGDRGPKSALRSEPNHMRLVRKQGSKAQVGPVETLPIQGVMGLEWRQVFTEVLEVALFGSRLRRPLKLRILLLELKAVGVELLGMMRKAPAVVVEVPSSFKCRI